MCFFGTCESTEQKSFSVNSTSVLCIAKTDLLHERIYIIAKQQWVKVFTLHLYSTCVDFAHLLLAPIQLKERGPEANEGTGGRGKRSSAPRLSVSVPCNFALPQSIAHRSSQQLLTEMLHLMSNTEILHHMGAWKLTQRRCGVVNERGRVEGVLPPFAYTVRFNWHSGFKRRLQNLLPINVLPVCDMQYVHVFIFSEHGRNCKRSLSVHLCQTPPILTVNGSKNRLMSPSEERCSFQIHISDVYTCNIQYR